MVTNRNAEGVLDPRLLEKPSSRSLKRALLVALRCVDPNAQKRPKMGHVIHMLEADEFPFRDVSTLYVFVPKYCHQLHLHIYWFQLYVILNSYICCCSDILYGLASCNNP